MRAGLALFGVLLLAGCTSLAPTTPGLQLEKVSYADLPGYNADTLLAARPALAVSCARLLKLPADRSLGASGRMGTAGAWQSFCRALPSATSEASLRRLIAQELQPYAVRDGNEPNGLFTGYYEATLHGSRVQQGAYQVPLYRRPPELVMVDLGAFRDELKGQRIAGEVKNGNLVPYADRAAIEGGKLQGRGLELVWLDNAVDAFFVQVQGSGRVKLAEGGELRLGYDGQNGHIYSAIGKELVRRGALKADEVSLQTIRAWLTAHPREAQAVMNSNRSYVFFRAVEGGDLGPVGAAQVPLTAKRSLAVDNTAIGYHVPVWLDAEAPQGGRLQRLMVAQDTGGAIRGVVRGDFFWGEGEEAEANAGLMKSRGRYYVLLPRSVAP